MPRILSFVAFLLFVAVAVGLGFLYLSYGIGSAYPNSTTGAPVTGETVVEWLDGHTSVQANDEESLYAALGFSHGLRETWTIAVLRQAAMGRLSSWYGASLAPVDSLALQLGIASNARIAFRDLPEQNRNLLQAYSDGVNSAIERRGARLQDEFAVLGVEPPRWEPWHSIAVERLFAWISVPPLPDSLLARAGPQAADLAERTELLRSFLGIHDLSHSAAWVVPGDQSTISARIVYGSLAEPLLSEHVLDSGDGSRRAAVLPGTPFPFFVTDRSGTTVLMPWSEATVEAIPSDSATFDLAYERITGRQGSEVVVSFRRGSGLLFLGESLRPVVDDSVRVERQNWVLNWTGLNAVTDASAFASMLAGDDAVFSLFSNNTLRASAGEAPAVTGTDRFRDERDGLIITGHPDWIEPLALRLDQLWPIVDSVGVEARLDDVHSLWAEQLAPGMIRGASSMPDPPPALRDALTYLRNWNFNYEGDNIAATIFDHWVKVYRDSTGAMPAVEAADTSYSHQLLLYYTLDGAVDTLIARYGDDLSQWRWERTQPDVRYMIGWPDTTAISRPRNRRYEPVQLFGRGHPSTLKYGRTPMHEGLKGAAAWEAYVPLSEPGELRVRRRRIDPRSFAGRYMIPEREPPFVSLPETADGPTTQLIPPQ